MSLVLVAPAMPPADGVSGRTALTDSSASSTVRMSANSRFWMPDPVAFSARYVRGSWSTFIMEVM